MNTATKTFIHILKNSFSNLPNVKITILGIEPYINAETLNQLIKNSPKLFVTCSLHYFFGYWGCFCVNYLLEFASEEPLREAS